MRNFSKTLTLMGLLAPVSANALGVGEIKLHSALNQVLEAEIPLITSGSESTSDIRVSLASPAAFAKAGIERPYYLSRLRFTPVAKNGRLAIKVSSKEVIREPFLNFLIEVNWPSGRMLREFTVLLDPPSTFDDTAITAVRTPTVQSKTVTEPHYPVDQASNYGFPAKKSAAPPKKSAKRYQAGDFVTSRRNDSLWALAERVKADPAVSHEQMMVALYENNPHAFFKKNMNALKAGQRLKIPPRETIVKTSRLEAVAELTRQNDQWRGTVASGTDSRTTSPPSKTNEIIAKQEPAPSESKLKLISPSAGETVAKATSDPSRSATVGKGELQNEMIETIRQENDELRSRLKDVEEQLARMQLLLTLKDKQLNALQNKTATGATPAEKIIDLEAKQPGTETQKPETQTQVAGPADQSVPPAVAPSNPETPFTVISEEIPATTSDLTSSAGPEEQALSMEQQPGTQNADPVTPTNPVQSTEPGAASQQTGPESLDQQPQPVGSGEQPVVNEPVLAEPAAPVQPPKAEATAESVETPPVPDDAQATSPTPPTEDDLWNDLLSEPYYIAGGGSAAVLAALLGFALLRRKSRIMAADSDSFLASPTSDRETAEENTAPKTVQPAQTNPVGVVESSFLSEFTPSDFDALETDHDDVDPVSEADVYLAYGRYQQAEDLIRSAIENYPERDECKLKLLEIHFATENRDAFEAYARKLETFRDDKPEFWAKVAEMGREICPNSPLFSQAAKGTESRSPADFGEIEFNDSRSDRFEMGIAGTQNDETDFDRDDLGFELADNIDHPNEFDEFGSDTTSEFASESVDFNQLSSDDDHAIEFNRFGNDDGFESDRDKDFSEMASLGQSEENRETFEFADTDSDSSSYASYDAVADEVSELADLTDGDEIETKLDLAKAYVDLDDQESARGILSQILVEGNDAQKSEAQALVDVLENKG